MTYLDHRRNDIDQIDKALTNLFEKRMKVVSEISKYKRENNIPILNSKREEAVIEKNSGYLENKELEPYLREFLVKLMELSREYQKEQGKQVW